MADKVLDHKVRVITEDSDLTGRIGFVQSVNDPFRIVHFNYRDESGAWKARLEVFKDEDLEDVQTRAQKESAMFADFERYGCN